MHGGGGENRIPIIYIEYSNSPSKDSRKQPIYFLKPPNISKVLTESLELSPFCALADLVGP